MTRRESIWKTCALMILALALALGDAPDLSADDGGELALRGLDPVRLVAGEEVEGREDLSLERGRFRYRFASEANRDAFVAHPKRYEIQKGGRCGAMPSATGRPDLFTVHGEKIYIFGTTGCREDFLAAPASFVGGEKARRVAILIYEGVELLDFAGPGEVFAAAGHGRSFEVFTVAATREAVTSQGFVEVTPAYAVADSPAPDILVIPGGGVRAVLGDQELMTWIREVAEDAEVVLSVCNGAFALAEAGLLEGLEATTHHGSIAGLRRSAPKTVVHADRRYVDNGKIVTAAGVSAGIDASLHLVARLLGPEVAQRTATYMEYDWHREAAEADERMARRD